MKLIIATNTNGIDRAFIKDTQRKAENLRKELLSGGWLSVKIETVDCLMNGTLKIKN